MRLSGLVEVARTGDPSARLVGDATVDVDNVTLDSRAVSPGDLFACVRGEQVDGHRFTGDAVAAGAVALMVDEEPLADSLAGGAAEVPRLVVADVRRSLGPVASAVHGDPSTRLDVIGVTGTNGKTTTTHMLADVLGTAGMPCVVIGTLSGLRTTPEAPELQRRLAVAVDEGAATVAMEVSSHALSQHRVDGTRFRIAAFTNLGRDHLDYHADMEDYFNAKARLFTPALCDEAVVLVDGPWGRRLAEQATVPVTTCSLDDVADLTVRADGSSFSWRGHPVTLGLPGVFNVANAVVAATVAERLGVETPVIATGLGAVGQVAGRFERIDAGQPFEVVVDFAHTPDALGAALDAARGVSRSRRVLVVFGCGGERDMAKRAEMGAVAAGNAEVVVVTADNSRSEATSDIVAAIVDGVRGVVGGESRLVVIDDRREAMAAAFDAAHPGDVVVVAGRGHETELHIGDTRVPFDDRVVARHLLAERGWGA